MLPPEPLVRTLNALDRLGQSDALTLIVRRKPHPLFQILSNTGYAWKEFEDAGGAFKYRTYKRC